MSMLNENSELRTAGYAVWRGQECLWCGKVVATVEEGVEHLKERERILVREENAGTRTGQQLGDGYLELWHDAVGGLQRSHMHILMRMGRGQVNVAIVGGKQGKALVTRTKKFFTK